MDLLSQVEIRKATLEDLPSMEWNGEYTHFRRLYQEIYENSLRGEAILWVADLPGASVIGQVFVQMNSSRKELADGIERAYLYGFRIKSTYRGKGIGSYMLSVVEDDLIRRGFRIAVLNVSRNNAEARQLYEHRGYRVVAPEPGLWSYLDQNGLRRWVDEPAWRMEKNLIPLDRIKGS
jgi:ribosomal protein S18 acetylase RimI-like enzyme